MSREKLLINDSKSNNGEVMRNKQIEEMAKELNFCKGIPYGICRTKVDCKHCLAEQFFNAGYRKQSELTPCDCCKFNPPSSKDGKPCSVCPAQAKMKGGAK